MKKRLSLLTVMVLILAFALSAVSFAEDGDGGYTYKVTVYSGRQGHFSSGKVWSKEYKQGEQVEIDQKSLGFVLDNDKYYVRGFRVAGHDNDEATGYQTLSFAADADVNYEIAYGLKGAMVSYKVKYQDASGKSLRKTDTFYGMAGDKPVVSYRYVEGYYPNAYTQGGTLSKTSSKNVFTFTYSKVQRPTVVEETEEGSGSNTGTQQTTTTTTRPTTASQPATPGTVTNPAGSTGVNNAATANQTANNNAQANARPGTGGTPENAGNNQNADNGDDSEQIDENGVPLTDAPEQYVDNDAEEVKTAGQWLSEHKPLVIIGAVVLAALIALIIYLIMRNRKKKA